MSDKNELKLSIEQYEAQLRQVEEALKQAKDSTERVSLESLKNDLIELVELTKQTINQSDGIDSTNSASNGSFDSEMAIFMSEIKSLESTENAAENCDSDEKFDEKLRSIKDELQAMVGKKCSAPHEHAWGAKSYHNAIICGLDDTRDYFLPDIKDFRLRILFTNPTHREMIPCSYYLDGSCKFDTDKCRFSHGELVAFGDLKEYKEPEFDKLQRNCIVLAKLPDRMWHKGRVLCANFMDKTCKVRLEHQRKEIDCGFEDLFPIFYDDDLSSDSSGSSSEDDEEYYDAMRRAYLIEKSLLTPATDQALGEWEKHTKGIGSKLMQKMGYIIGTGLGSNGEGIITPISAQILPPGKSLDHCMELREAANGDKDLFSVERKLKKVKKVQEMNRVKAYERESTKVDVFSFLNDNILTTSSKTDSKSDKVETKVDLKNHSTKNLNVVSLKIAEDIRRKEKEIKKVKEAMRRHGNRTDVHKRLQGQLAVKNQELMDLKKSETNVAREQTSRKHKDKLSVF